MTLFDCNPWDYSQTYFELDSEEATHCHLISCVYINVKGTCQYK